MATAALGAGSGSEDALLRAVTEPGVASTALRWIMALEDNALLRRAALRVQPGLVNPSTALSVADALRRSGDFTVSTRLAQRVLEINPDNPRAQRLVAVGTSSQALVKQGWQGKSVKQELAYQPAERSISYLLHNSLPYASAGYATRTHGLLAALARDDWQVHAATRLGYPYDTWDQDDTRSVPLRDDIDGVSYHRLLDGRRPYLKWPVEGYVDDYANHVVELARKHRVGLIHGASNFRNGFAAIKAARRLGLPSIYEVRGLWELTRMSREPEYAHSEMFALTAALEAAACREADQVLAITAALRDEMVSRGVPIEKIVILPNGVDTSRFTVRPRDQELAAELGVTDKVVIGYIGSILDYEGIDLLLDAVARLRRRRDDFHLLVVGDGAAYDDVVAQGERSGVLDIATFTGRVPHDQVERYYSLVDIAPFPRKPLPVCEAVSPLKPFEAMAMGKVPVVSSVAALTEIVEDGENGLVFAKGEVGSLVEALDRLVGEKELRTRLGTAAREWVVRERDWSVLVKALETVYTELMTARPGRPKIGV
jgi:glycosyltransferase involved in cell wall biosynthesis